MAELSPEDKELYRLRTTGFWVSIAIGFIALRVVMAFGQPLWAAFAAALVIMVIAGRVLPWYREVQRREGGRKPPVISMLLTQGIAFGAILYLIQTLWKIF
jgi:predicted PurR-regulated permease PerM